MPQIFNRSSNTLSRISIFGSLFVIAGAAWAFGVTIRSPYVTRAGVVRDQPVPFSHRRHAGQLGIDCRYCHTSVEDSAFAGIPPTKTCMTCHSQIWLDSPMLEPVRASYRTGESIAWTRVHDLPSFTYFDHSIHVAKGIGCDSCHGRVADMPLLWQEHSLHMDWCLGCHRDPTPHVRPREEVFNADWSPPADEEAFRERLAAEYHVEAGLDYCSVCHR